MEVRRNSAQIENPELTQTHSAVGEPGVTALPGSAHEQPRVPQLVRRLSLHAGVTGFCC